jgi:transcriptional regulator with PAS, ATPase and Fis domain
MGEVAGNPVLVGHSPRLSEIRRLIQRLGQGRSPVLLLGETGTGKEVVARAIHHAGPGGPFVPIDCSALVATLLESELFGHTKGAFTGAVSHKPGLLELADGGTAFFDEIGELAVRLQGKLLRVIEDKEIRPVGGVAQRRTSFRVIAATNRDLAREVERGRFRRDLYYRLNVVTLRLPPLRSRKEDVPALAEHFLECHGRQHHLSPEVLEALVAYDWPGNVRELENCIERMVAFNSGPMLHLADLPTGLQSVLHQSQDRPFVCEGVLSREIAAMGAAESPPVGIVPLEETERQAILKALDCTQGDRGRAAQLLGIGRTTLYRKLKRYRLSPLAL